VTSPTHRSCSRPTSHRSHPGGTHADDRTPKSARTTDNRGQGRSEKRRRAGPSAARGWGTTCVHLQRRYPAHALSRVPAPVRTARRRCVLTGSVRCRPPARIRQTQLPLSRAGAAPKHENRPGRNAHPLVPPSNAVERRPTCATQQHSRWQLKVLKHGLEQETLRVP